MLVGTTDKHYILAHQAQIAYKNIGRKVSAGQMAYVERAVGVR